MRRTTRHLGIAVCSLVLAACGGGEAAPATVDTGTATGVTDPAASGQLATTGIDPATGLPIAAGAAPTTPDVRLPQLNGGDVSGLGGAGGTDIFTARASTEDEDFGDDSDAITEGNVAEDGDDSPSPSVTPPTTPDGGRSNTGGGRSNTGGGRSDATDGPSSFTTSYRAARIWLDGKTYAVPLKGAFPSGTPMFRVIAVTSTTIDVQLVAGEFAGGFQAFTLQRNSMKTILNQSEGIHYRIKYLSPVSGT